MTLDMTAAFDCIRHEILLQKLPLYKFGNGTVEWIRSYLSFRSNFVEIGDKRSRIHPAPTDVPQGSCLGPLLYLIAMNELPEAVRNVDCRNENHNDQKELFGRECLECGTLPIFADDGIYIYAGENRNANQWLKKSLNESKHSWQQMDSRSTTQKRAWRKLWLNKRGGDWEGPHPPSKSSQWRRVQWLKKPLKMWKHSDFSELIFRITTHGYITSQRGIKQSYRLWKGSSAHYTISGTLYHGRAGGSLQTQS